MTRPASASSRATSSTAPPHAAAMASSTSPRPAPSTASWTLRYCCSVTVMLLFDLSVQGRVRLVLWPHKVRRIWWRRTWKGRSTCCALPRMSGHAPGGGDLGRLCRRAQPGMAGRGGPRRALLDQHRLLRPEQGLVPCFKYTG